MTIDIDTAFDDDSYTKGDYIEFALHDDNNKN